MEHLLAYVSFETENTKIKTKEKVLWADFFRTKASMLFDKSVPLIQSSFKVTLLLHTLLLLFLSFIGLSL